MAVIRGLVNEAQQLSALAGLHDVLEREGIDYWVFGGWAVDLHVGTVTRPHGDLDVAIWLEDHTRVSGLLEADGWTHTPAQGDDGSTLYERGVVRLELAFLARDADGVVYTPLSDGRGSWADGAFGADVGMVGGVRARAIGRDALKAEKSAVHGDPTTTAKDRADLATLERHA
jgi:hypothetical protein